MTIDEIRKLAIRDWEQQGMLSPLCQTCLDEIYPYLRTQWYPGRFWPRCPSHKPSPNCESGGRPHCTCDTCF